MSDFPPQGQGAKINATIDGNIVGVQTLISSGTLTLAGGNNITLSQNGNAITISAAAIGAGSFTAGASNLGNLSGNTGVISNQIVFAGGNNITLSQSINVASATITISAFDQSQQTNNIIRDFNIGGNTAGVFADITSGTLSLIGGTNITLSQNQNTVTIYAHHPMSAGMSNLGNTAGTSTTNVAHEQLVLVGGNNITLSQSIDTNAELATITINAQTQSQQTQNIIRDVSLIGNNTSGTLADITSGTLYLAGGNNITLSQNANSITISAFNQSAVGSLNASSGTMSISAPAGSLIQISNNNSTINVINLLSSATTVSGVTTVNVIGAMASRFALEGHQHAGVMAAGVSNLSNDSGNTKVIPGQLVLAGGPNIILSQNTDATNGITVTISAAGAGTASFSAGASGGAHDVGNLGTVANRLVFVGGDNITLSQSTNGNSATVTISGALVVGGNFSAGASGGTHDVGSLGTIQNQIVFVGGNNITLSQSTNGQSATVTVSAFNQSQQTNNIIRDVSLIGNNTSGVLADITSGTLYLAGGYNITLSQNQNSITLSGPEALTAVVSNLGNTAGTTGAPALMDKLIFVGGTNITLSQSIGTGASSEDVTITINAQTQSQQTQNIIRDISIIGNTSGTFVDITSGTLYLAGGNNIILSQNQNSLTISASNQTVQTQNLFDVSISGNTSGTFALVSSGTLTLAGGNNITLNQGGNAITISGGNSYSAGISNLGNTSGNTGLVSKQIVFVGSGSITLSQSTTGGSATLTISANQTEQTQNVIRQINLSGNTTGTLAVVTAGTLTIAGGNNITLSQAGGNAITISAKADPTLSYWQNANQSISTQATSNGTFFLFPLTPVPGNLFPGNMTVSTMLLNFSASETNVGADEDLSQTWRIGVYTINGVSLSILNSASVSWGSPSNNTNTRLFYGERFATIHSSDWSAQPSFSNTKYYVGMLG
ncbi:MAG: hypothetical protein EPN89_18890, partial [Methylovulum sp.]